MHLSVILPVYDEEQNIAPLVEASLPSWRSLGRGRPAPPMRRPMAIFPGRMGGYHLPLPMGL